MAKRNESTAKMEADRKVKIQQLADAVKTSGANAYSVQALVTEAFRSDDTVILRAAEQANAYFANLEGADTNERNRRKNAALDVLRVQIKRALTLLNKGPINYPLRGLKVDKAGVASWKPYQPKPKATKKADEAPVAENATEATAYLRAVVAKMVEQTFLTEKQAAAILAIADGEAPARTMKKAA